MISEWWDDEDAVNYDANSLLCASRWNADCGIGSHCSDKPIRGFHTREGGHGRGGATGGAGDADRGRRGLDRLGRSFDAGTAGQDPKEA